MATCDVETEAFKAELDNAETDRELEEQLVKAKALMDQRHRKLKVLKRSAPPSTRSRPAANSETVEEPSREEPVKVPSSPQDMTAKYFETADADAGKSAKTTDTDAAESAKTTDLLNYGCSEIC